MEIHYFILIVILFFYGRMILNIFLVTFVILYFTSLNSIIKIKNDLYTPMFKSRNGSV